MKELDNSFGEDIAAFAASISPGWPEDTVEKFFKLWCENIGEPAPEGFTIPSSKKSKIGDTQ